MRFASIVQSVVALTIFFAAPAALAAGYNQPDGSGAHAGATSCNPFLRSGQVFDPGYYNGTETLSGVTAYFVAPGGTPVGAELRARVQTGGSEVVSTSAFVNLTGTPLAVSFTFPSPVQPLANDFTWICFDNTAGLFGFVVESDKPPDAVGNTTYVTLTANDTRDMRGTLDIAELGISTLVQSRIDTNGGESVEVQEGGLVSDNAIRLKATLSAAPSGTQLQVEVKKVSDAFDGNGLVPAANCATTGLDAYCDADLSLDAPSTKHGPYKWRARAVNGAQATDWVEYDTAAEPENGSDFFRAFKVSVSLVQTADDLEDPTSSVRRQLSALESPCELYPGQQFYGTNHPDSEGAYGFNKYFKQLFSCINDYYKENTYNTVQFDFTTYPSDANAVEWQSSEATLSQRDYADDFNGFVRHARALAGGEAESEFTVAVFPGASKNGVPNEIKPIRIPTAANEFDEDPRWSGIAVSESDLFGDWAHEIGHGLGIFLSVGGVNVPDLYNEDPSKSSDPMRSNAGAWDLMGTGNRSGFWRTPPHMSAVSKVYLGLLSTETFAAPSLPTKTLTAVSVAQYGDSVLKYYPTESVVGTTPYYLVEARNREYGEWDETLPSAADGNAVVYYVDPREGSRTVEVPGLHAQNTDSYAGLVNDGVLNPIINETYTDIHNWVTFEAQNGRDDNGVYKLDIAVRNPSSAFVNKYVGSVLIGQSLASGLRQQLRLLADGEYPDFASTPTLPGKAEENGRDEATNDIPNDFYRPAHPALYRDAPYTVRGKIAGATILLAIAVVVHLLLLAAFLVVRSHPAKAKKTEFAVTLGLAYAVTASVVFLLATLGGFLAFRVTEGNLDYDAGAQNNVAWPFESIQFAPPNDVALSPDTDLHVFCDDGRHVGTNYATGGYDVQIENAIANGDSTGSPEWIFYPPEGNEGCRHVVSSRDNAAFLAANPDIAAQIADATDSYDLYARVIDPVTGVHTSAVLAGETIAPGAENAYAVDIDQGGNVSAVRVVVDTAPPDTAIDSGPQPQTSETSASFTFSSSEEGSAFECSLDEEEFAPCASPAEYAALADGVHSFAVRATDPAGNVDETPALYEWAVDTGGTLIFLPAADTYLREGSPNQNQGGESILRVRSSGNNRALVRFDSAAVAEALPQGAAVTAASLEMVITENANNWGSTGRTVDVHRVSKAWTEPGATWNCAVDSSPTNQNDDCAGATAWEMGKPNEPSLHPWVAQPTATVNVTNGLSGTVAWDVKTDVLAFLGGTSNDGWLVRKTNEGATGLVEFGSRETAFAPKLVVSYVIQ